MLRDLKLENIFLFFFSFSTIFDQSRLPDERRTRIVSLVVWFWLGSLFGSYTGWLMELPGMFFFFKRVRVFSEGQD